MPLSNRIKDTGLIDMRRCAYGSVKKYVFQLALQFEAEVDPALFGTAISVLHGVQQGCAALAASVTPDVGAS
jgi:hypothetical protein